MRLLGAFILVALALLATFTVANWSVLTMPTTLSFAAFEVEGPLGLILVGVVLVFAALFAVYATALRAAMLLESRRRTQELETQRKLADSAESSRLNDLRTQIESEFTRLRGLLEDIATRIDDLGPSMRTSLDESANGLAAQIGEMDDKLDHVLGTAGHAPGERPTP